MQWLSIWRDELWGLLIQRLGHHFVGCWCIWFSVLFCWFSNPFKNAGVSESLLWGIWLISLKHKITAISSAALLIIPLMKQFRNRTFPGPGAPAFEPGLGVKRGTVAAGCLGLIKCESTFGADITFSLAFSAPWWRWTQSVEELCSLVLRLVGEELSFSWVSAEFCASSLFLGCRPILFCGYDFIHLLAQNEEMKMFF